MFGWFFKPKKKEPLTGEEILRMIEELRKIEPLVKELQEIGASPEDLERIKPFIKEIQEISLAAKEIERIGVKEKDTQNIKSIIEETQKIRKALEGLQKMEPSPQEIEGRIISRLTNAIRDTLSNYFRPATGGLNPHFITQDDPMIKEIFLPERRQAIARLNGLITLALEATKTLLSQKGFLLSVLSRRAEISSDQIEEINGDLIEAEKESRIIPSFSIPRTEVFNPSSHLLNLQKCSGHYVEAKELKKSLWRARKWVSFFSLVAAGFAFPDCLMVYLILTESFRGTYGFAYWLICLLALSISIALIGSAHIAMTKAHLKWVKWISEAVFALLSFSLGILRVISIGFYNLGFLSLSLNILSVLPIPVLAYFAAFAIGKTQELAEEAGKIQKDLKPIVKKIAAFEISKKLLKRKQSEEIAQEKKKVKLERILRKVQEARIERLRREQTAAYDELRETIRDWEALQDGIIEKVLKDLFPDLKDIARQIAWLIRKAKGGDQNGKGQISLPISPDNHDNYYRWV